MFVLGGYIANAETWAKLTDDWQTELDAAPRLAYVKFIEGVKRTPSGAFYRWKPHDALAKLAKFRAIIEKYDLAAFSLSFRVDHLTETHAAVPKKWLNPYYSAVVLLIPELARALPDLGLPRERLDIIFDEQVMEQGHIMWAWTGVRDVKKLDPPDILEILQSPPIWRSDNDVLPLQAADMQATWIRLILEAQRDGRCGTAMPGFKKPLRQLRLEVDRDYFEKRAARIAWYAAGGDDG